MREERLRSARSRAVRDLGLGEINAISVGGSDGNFCAALGIPTIDGVGAVGAGAHARDEWVDTGSLPARIHRLESLLEREPLAKAVPALFSCRRSALHLA
jgi:acetylornithine deacetylase/succinyl-diaminopimelate desuccinylase-like protein